MAVPASRDSNSVETGRRQGWRRWALRPLLLLLGLEAAWRLTAAREIRDGGRGVTVFNPRDQSDACLVTLPRQP